MKRFVSSLLVAVLTSLSLVLSTPHNALATSVSQQGAWCGNGSEADDYGFTYDFSQPHWTVGNGLVSEEAMIEVDVILDKLNADQLAQTMILVLPASEVGIPVNCAVHFLRYMELGLVDGPHADNGFAFLFIVGDKSIDVHYGVGLGLPALTAQGLTPLNRLAEDTYAQTGSLDTAIIETVKAYDAYVRSEYQVSVPSAVPENIPVPQNNSGNGQSSIFIILLVVLFIIIVGVIVSIVSGLFSSSSSTTTHYDDTYTPDSDDNTPYTPPSRSSYSPPSRPSSPPPSRGGSGSGRSGRGG